MIGKDFFCLEFNQAKIIFAGIQNIKAFPILKNFGTTIHGFFCYSKRIQIMKKTFHWWCRIGTYLTLTLIPNPNVLKLTQYLKIPLPSILLQIWTDDRVRQRKFSRFEKERKKQSWSQTMSWFRKRVKVKMKDSLLPKNIK